MSEFEQIVLLSDGVQVDNAATSEVESAAAEGSLKDRPATVSLSPHLFDAQTSAEVSTDNVAVAEGPADDVAGANWALEGEFGSSPFWALLARAGYKPW